MNRRGFLKTALTTPLITPMLLASKRHLYESELFLISDEPHRYLSLLLGELKKDFSPLGTTFSFTTPHPRESALRSALSAAGWKPLTDPSQAEMTLSHSFLRSQARPSFSLVKDGRIWDIRSRKLYPLWREMNRSALHSSSMTTASLRRPGALLKTGDSAHIYQSGRRIDRISLKESTDRVYSFPSGKLSVSVKNGLVLVSESSCLHKICLYSPPVSLPGERIICAPNHFMVEIQGSRGVDTVIG